MQTQQHAGRLHRPRLGTEVLARQIQKAEFVLGGALPEEVEIDPVGDLLRGGQQFSGTRRIEPQDHVRGLHLAALAAGVLDLQASAGFGQHGTGLEAAVFFEENLGHDPADYTGRGATGWVTS